MAIRAYRSAAAVDPAAWRSVVGDRPFSSPAWYTFGARVLPEDQFSFHLAEPPNGPPAAAALWRRSREQLPVAQPLARWLVGRLVARYPLLICQSPIASQSGLYLDGLLGGRDRLLAELIAAAEGELRSGRASFLIFPFLDGAAARSSAWQTAFFGLQMPPNHHLAIEWPDFETFLRSRKASVRKDYRLHANRALRLGLSVRVESGLPDMEAGLRLVRAHERAHGSGRTPWARGLAFEAESIGGSWLVARQAGEMVGCGLVLRDRADLMLTLLGLKPDAPQVYFALMYAAIQYAIETGASGIYGGSGADYFKARLGYRPTQNRFIRVRAAGKSLQRLGRWLAGREAGADGWWMNLRREAPERV